MDDTARSPQLGLVEILLVEDDDADALLTMELLRQDRIANNVRRVSTGEDAIKMLQDESYRPELILLDLHLPNMSGHDVLQVVRESERHHLTPVIILTTSDADTDIVNAYELHANSYVQKPIDFDEFRRVIQVVEDFWLAIVKRPPPA